jgi:hypothetical protein
MVRLWCRSFADELDFATDYQPWVVANFSGVLCVDEVYQDELALLLAVDPAAPDGDRLVGYSLVSEGVDHEKIRTFLVHLRAAGIAPAEVITDDSRMYPTVLAEIWPSAAHQLCSMPRVTSSKRSTRSSRRCGGPSPCHHQPHR